MKPDLTPFSDCPPDTAARIMRELDWGEHFIGAEMGSASGNREVYLYSLEEAGRFLFGGAASLSSLNMGRGGIVDYDTSRFVDWIRTAVGDDDLACAIEGSLKEGQSFAQRSQAISALVNQRLIQLARILGIDFEEHDSEEHG
jgi:hypothetical protein